MPVNLLLAYFATPARNIHYMLILHKNFDINVVDSTCSHCRRWQHFVLNYSTRFDKNVLMRDLSLSIFNIVS